MKEVLLMRWLAPRVAASPRRETPSAVDTLHRTGAVYGRHAARRAAHKQPSSDGTVGFWNEYRISVDGTQIRVTLNGYIVSEGAIPAPVPNAGHIGLQYHTGKVQFRLPRVRRL